MSIISYLFSNIRTHITHKKNPHSPHLLLFIVSALVLPLCLGISGCSLSDHSSSQSSFKENDIADTDFGSTILSLLTPDDNSGELTDQDIQEAFSYFCRQTFLNEASSDSISLHYTLAYPEACGLNDITPSFGEAGSDSTEAVSAENYLYLLSLFPYDSLTENQQLTYDIFKESLEDSISLADYPLYAEPLSKTIGIQAQLPILLSEYTFYQERDVEDYLTLLTHLPDYFSELAEFECQKADAGLFMHEENAVAILEQCDEMLLLKSKKKKDNFLISSFEERLEELSKTYPVSEEQKNGWIKKNEQVLEEYFYPAYEALGTTFKTLLKSGENTGGLAYFPEGKVYYEKLVRHNTGSNRSIGELKNLINERILSCASVISAAMEKSDDFDDALSEAEAYQLPFSAAADILSYLKTQISTAFPMPSQISFTVLSVPESLAEYLSPAFYLVPPIDCKTQNCIYINEPQIRDDLSFFTTLAHEGYPGHLYQNAIFSSTEPEDLRSLLSYPGYSEGWASYAELFSYHLAGLSDTAALLQENNALLTLCMYAMADIHIHYDGYTEGGLKEYLNGFGIKNENSIHAIYLQILAEPANYLKYTVGCLEFLSLKEDLEERLGDSFDLSAFHEAVLTTGPCSFSLLREEVMKQLQTG